MFVQYSFVEHRSREALRPEPVHVGETGFIMLGAAFMVLASLAYIAVYGLI